MTAYRRVYDSRHLQADCQESGSAPEPDARQSSMGYRFRVFVSTSVCIHTQEVLAEMRTVVEGVVDAILYPSITDKSKNRGFAFVEFDSHRAAAMARRKLLPGHIPLWGQPVAVDWAEPEHDVDEDVMATVSTSYAVSTHTA